MARPPLQIGSHGKITVTESGGQWKALARFRDTDGVTRPVARWGPTPKAAEKALQAAFDERRGKSATQLTRKSKVRDIAKDWIAKVERTRKGTTFDTYSLYLRNVIEPELGNLYLHECTVPRLEDLMDDLEEKGYSAEARRTVRTVISGILGLAVRYGLLDANPVKQMARIEGGARKRAQSLSVEQLRDFSAKLDADKVAARYDLADMVRVMLGTGVRVGEALALRWKDINDSDKPVTLKLPDEEIVIPPRSISINGNVVWVKGKGVIRHDGKTFASKRLVAMPDYLRMMLLVRRPPSALGDDPVFPAGTLTSAGKLTWKYPSNTTRSIRRLRRRIGYDWVTSHVFRKTVVTLLNEAGFTARDIADLVGHAKISITQDVYMGRGSANPALAEALESVHRG